MKILFVKTKLSNRTLGGVDYSLCEPLEFELLAAALPDHDAKILDLRFDSNFEETIRRFSPDIVATTSMSVNVYAAREILKRTKELDPSITTLVGGYHPTVAPEDFSESYIDAIAIGQSVDTIREVVRALEKGLPLATVPGLAIPADNETVTLTLKRPKVFDLDSQPIPNRSLNPHHRQYYFCEYWQPAAIMRASIGCHGRCNFCALWQLTDGKYLTHSANRVVDEIESIPEKYVFFIDDNFLPDGHEKRIEAIRAEIMARNLEKEYYFSTRADYVADHPEVIERWVDAGLRRIFFGLESPDDGRLNALNKGITADANRRAVRICQANGVDVTACFIIQPDFTEEDFLRVYEYAIGLELNIVAYLVLTPHPGTILHARRKNEIMHPDYELWDHLHSVFKTSLPEREFYSQYSQLWMKTYTPITIDGGKRLSRLLWRSTWAQKKFLCKKAVTMFPKIALGIDGNREASFVNWLNWAGGGLRRWLSGNDTTESYQVHTSPQSLLPSLRKPSNQVRPLAHGSEKTGELARKERLG